MDKFYNLRTIPYGLCGEGGHVIHKDINIGAFNYDEHNGYLNILIRRFWEKWWCRWPSYPPTCGHLKRGT